MRAGLRCAVRRTVPAVLAGIVAALAAAGCDCDLGLGGPSEPSGPRGPVAVVFELDGELPQFPGPSGMLGGTSLSQQELIRRLDSAAADLQVQQVIVHLASPRLGWARAREIGDAITRVAESGKPVTCHLEAADNLTYWMAARSCPSIELAPAGGIELVGLSLEAIFVRELLEKLGIDAEVLRVGRYKDAAESLTRDAMSAASREAHASLLDRLQELLVEGIASGRDLSDERVAELIDGGPYAAARAVEVGLVDRSETFGSLLGRMRDSHAGGVVDDYGEQPPEPLSLGELLQMLGGGRPEERRPSGPRIALVPVVGPILGGGAGDELLAGMAVVRDVELVDALSEAARDDSIRAAVLRVDSPGGSALASDNIWQAVRDLNEVKPVVVSLGDVAASGGYYVASAGREIYAAEGTLTGSIGVIGGKLVVSDAMKEIGVTTETLTRGDRAALASPFRAFTAGERAALEELIRSSYDLFVDRVAAGRGLSRDEVLAAAEGRVWTGAQALDQNLVTSVGTLHDALERARELGELPGGAVEIHPPPRSLMEMLSETLGSGGSAALVAARRLPSGRQALALASLLGEHRLLAFSPLVFRVR
jgi:protease IV